MDRILSARVDESILNKISFLAHRLRVSKKRVIEGAVQMYARKMESAGDMDVFAQTSGAWKRKESIGQTASRARIVFRKSMERFRK